MKYWADCLIALDLDLELCLNSLLDISAWRGRYVTFVITAIWLVAWHPLCDDDEWPSLITLRICYWFGFILSFIISNWYALILCILIVLLDDYSGVACILYFCILYFFLHYSSLFFWCTAYLVYMILSLIYAMIVSVLRLQITIVTLLFLLILPYYLVELAWLIFWWIDDLFWGWLNSLWVICINNFIGIIVYSLWF